MNFKDIFSPEEYLEEFGEFLETVEYSDRNPLNTEMFFMWCMVRTFKPRLFIESGTFRGYSANFICGAMACNDNESAFVTIGFDEDSCITFARRRLEKYPFATVVEGDSRIYIDKLTREERPTAFFIDGPKGKNMPPLFAAIRKKFDDILFIGVHDSEKRKYGSVNRKRVKQFYAPEFPIVFCDKTFQVCYQDMDERLIGKSELRSWKPFYFNGEKQECYGTETAYVLTKHPYKHPWIPRPLLRPYRWLICSALRLWL